MILSQKTYKSCAKVGFLCCFGKYLFSNSCLHDRLMGSVEILGKDFQEKADQTPPFSDVSH